MQNLWVWGLMPTLFPKLPLNEDTPPTIYQIMQSICNFGKPENEKIKTYDLAKYAREKIFNFDYPLSQNVNKEEFECNILNHYMMRRINFETVTLFNIQLNIKLNNIMPKYNKMFDMFEKWSPFEDGEKQIHESTDDRTIDVKSEGNTTNSLKNNSTTTTNSTEDNRQSNTPQNQLQNVKDGKYVSNYAYIQNDNNSTDNSTSDGTSNTNNTSNTIDNNVSHETWTKTIGDKINLYKEYQTTINNIYDMIYSELDILFYGLM